MRKGSIINIGKKREDQASKGSSRGDGSAPWKGQRRPKTDAGKQSPMGRKLSAALLVG